MKTSLMLLLLILSAGAFAADKPAHIYLRFKPLNADGVYASVWMNLHRSPWSMTFPDLPRAGKNYARFRIARNAYSDWAELPPDWGAVVLTFSQDAPLPTVEAEVQLATAADDRTVFKTMTVKETGAIVSLVLPPDFPKRGEKGDSHLFLATHPFPCYT
jgi:hypothetical protein